MRIDQRGLTKEEVNDRIEKGLVNVNVISETRTIKGIVVQNIVTFFNLINLILALCVLLVHSYRNVLFMGVVLCNIGIGIVQEIRAKLTVDKLSLLVAAKAKVLRDGKIVLIALDEIVMDDILILEGGKQISADAKVISGNCEVDESLLTGESDLVYKKEGDILLSGSYIVGGHVQAQVIHVGKDNYANQIAKEAKKIKKVKSEMMLAINRIIKGVSIFIVPMGLVMFYRQYAVLHLGLEQAVTNTVGSMIGMIPEGLVLLSSMVLAVSIIRLGKEKALVQELYCIETLARVDVLCLDKTGTITEGSMEVEEVVPFSEKPYREPLNALTSVLKENNPTFLALEEYFSEGTSWKVKNTIPFSSATKWSSATFKQHGTYVIGAPEFVLQDKITAYERRLHNYAKSGKRVLLLAYSTKEPEGKQLPRELEPIAFILIRDKIRENAKETLAYFQSQGVQLKVISGDHPDTVLAIAKEAGMGSEIQGIDASALDSEEKLNQALENYDVFGRVTPDQKLQIVKALQKAGHTVAMTGDGVNDVLALKEADCSVAMEAGSDIARKTAQIVLLDSDFSAMPKVLAEGRRAINNLERSASLFLVKTTYAFLLALIFMFLKIPYPLIPIQLTLISGFAIGIPSFLLALEPNYDLVKEKFLYHVIKKALPGGFLIVTNVMIAVGIAQWQHYLPEARSTLAVLGIAIGSMYVLYQICKPLNKKRGGMLLVLIAAFLISARVGQDWFTIGNISLEMGIIVLALFWLNIVLYGLYRRIINFILHVMK